MACLFSFAVAGEFNHGWSRRKEVKAGQTQGETSNIEHRTLNIEHRTSNAEHRTSNIER
jgi:hypothetical protein